MVASIRPILKYPGAKWKLADWIVSQFPEHRRYLEPYCGSAAVFFQKAPADHEILNDAFGSVVNLFTVLRDPETALRLAEQIELTPWSEAKYERYERDYDSSPDTVENARRFLLRSWQAHGGTIHQISGWKHNGLHATVYPTRLWKKLPERLLATVDRLKDAEIRNRPALDMIAYYNDPSTLIYADPPYLLSTRSRKYYKHEMTDGEHADLLNALDDHQGPVVLSGYTHPLYEKRLSHWHKVSTPAVTEHGNIREEVLWLNPQASTNRQLSFDFEIA